MSRRNLVSIHMWQWESIDDEITKYVYASTYTYVV